MQFENWITRSIPNALILIMLNHIFQWGELQSHITPWHMNVPFCLLRQNFRLDYWCACTSWLSNSNKLPCTKQWHKKIDWYLAFISPKVAFGCIRWLIWPWKCETTCHCLLHEEVYGQLRVWNNEFLSWRGSNWALNLFSKLKSMVAKKPQLQLT